MRTRIFGNKFIALFTGNINDDIFSAKNNVKFAKNNVKFDRKIITNLPKNNDEFGKNNIKFDHKFITNLSKNNDEISGENKAYKMFSKMPTNANKNIMFSVGDYENFVMKITKSILAIIISIPLAIIAFCFIMGIVEFVCILYLFLSTFIEISPWPIMAIGILAYFIYNKIN